MAPSPSWRRSPGRETGAVSHKRRSSFDGGLDPVEKDDDLELFSELNRIESEDFLLQSSDDFEDVFTTKLKSVPGIKLGITIPARGPSSDLLNADGDKHDYDWLLTPPESPLFPSLDDEPAPANLVHSGRPRSRSVSISRSSVMEKNLRSSRGSASPHRASPSPRSVSSSANGRPSSAPHSSPNPTLRPSNSLRRPSPQPIRSSPPPPRSATPPPRRSNVASGGTRISTGLRGTSPVRTGRGNSASPKVRTWQPDALGFSLEAPPNLRTSLADRPASYVRGSSPASRSSSKESSSKLGRRSMSPSASRSISSLRSHERDRLSSYSRGSPASSVEDDTDSLQSIPVRSSEKSVPRRVISGFPNTRPSGFSRKPIKTNSPISAPKRSFDSAMRQMDRRSPQNMFRPLLSSVPSSTLYGGKASSSHLVMVSMNSSITTSSNASSDQGMSGAPDTEESDQYQDDVTSEYRREAYPGTQDEALSVNKLEDAHESPLHETRDELFSVGNHTHDEYETHLRDTKEHSHQDVVIASTSTSSSVPVDSMEIGGSGHALLCSTCGRRYLATETTDRDVPICMECQLNEKISTIPIPVISIGLGQNSSDPLMRMSDEHELREVEPPMVVAESLGAEKMSRSSSTLLTSSNEENAMANRISGDESKIGPAKDSPAVPVHDNMLMLPELLARGQFPYASGLTNIPSEDGDLQTSADGFRLKASLDEGISVLLLNRSSSSKGPILQSRNIMASTISYEDSSYARDSTTSIRSSIGFGSASTSSSMDLTLSRHAETFMQRQLSSTRSEMSSKPRSNESSNSGFSTHASQAFDISTVAYRENLPSGDSKQIFEDFTEQLPELLSTSENAKLLDAETFLCRKVTPEDDNLSCSTSCREKDADTIEKTSCIVIAPPDCDPLASLPADDLNVLDKTISDSFEKVAGTEDQAVILETSAEEKTMPDNDADLIEIVEIQDDNSQTVMIDDLDGTKDSIPHSGDSGVLHGIVEEPTVTVEDQGGRRTRSLTLEEATDTILFCSSIVHDLAYKAATVAIEKEKENLVPLEGSVPTVTIPGGNRSSDPVNPRGRTPSKRSAKSQRPKHRQEDKKENEPTPYHVTRTNEKPFEPMTRIVGLQNKVDNRIDDMKPPKMESKCSCTIM